MYDVSEVVDAHSQLYLMRRLMVLVMVVDADVFLLMSSLLMAEQQQLCRTVVVTLYLLKNVYDTPFLCFFNFIDGEEKKIGNRFRFDDER